MANRAKRVRVSYHDSVPLGDYDSVYEREGTLRRIGTSTLPTSSSRTATDSWSTTTSWTPPDDLHYALDPDGNLYDMALEADVMEEQVIAEGKKKGKKSLVSRRPHVTWMEVHRDTYLKEMIRWSGRGDFRTARECPDCIVRRSETPGTPEYRCIECSHPDLVCLSCCLKRHRVHPLHWIQYWNEGCFERRSLRALGLKYQLGHSSMYCPNPVPCHADLLILHTNGFHSVAIQFCNCSAAIPQHIQLLRRQLYPASQIVVKTCATFALLRQLHKLALATKASTYDFYRAFERLTVNTGIDCPKSRYRALFRMVLQWRHLKMLKWGGRGHDRSGAAGTRPGELAVPCPSCPRPGVNLPEGWEDASEGMRFLYTMIVCMDANFRLKNNLVSNYSQDPGLGTGWAYMLERKPYENYVLSRVNDEDISTCVGFQALSKANTKNSKGQRYTGVGATVCGRSEMILPLGVGNLHKGERYSNMDYIFGSTLQHVLVPLIVISYDIACQWFTNLFKRIESHWPQEIRLRPGTQLIPAIPKLHEPMHQTANHQGYSLNYIPGVGLSDCECPERVWGPHNILGNATKAQGPGSRQDVLDDHFGYWNWCKYISLGTTLLRRYKSAIADRNIQREGHRGLSESLDKKLVEKWEKMCTEWEGEIFPKTKANPYETDGVTISESQVRKELAKEEEGRLASGGISLHATSASAFVVLALDLEEAQRRLHRLAKKTTVTATNLQESTLTEQRNVLRNRIKAWEQLCPIYMPGLLQYQTTSVPSARHSPTSSTDKPEETIIWLPSRIPSDKRATVCQNGLDVIEDKLRSAQCQDALDGVRHILKIKTRMIAFKNRNIRGQREGTRSRAVIDRVHERAKNMAQKYRAARAAKMELVGPGVWEQTFSELKDEDVRGYQDANRLKARVGRRGVLEDDVAEASGSNDNRMDVDEEGGSGITLIPEEQTRRDGTGETRRELSWIWRAPRSVNAADEDDILRAEWAKSRARALRTSEEVLLLKEEMRRVLEFLKWKARWWKERKEQQDDTAKDFREGIQSYAQTQGNIQAALSNKFQKLWMAPLDEGDGDSDEEQVSMTEAANEGDDDDEGDERDDKGDDWAEDDEDDA